MEFIEYPDSELMMMDLANIIAGELGATLRHEDSALFAVPGGTTPGPVFDSLCAADVAWDRVKVMLTDERWVPESSDRSNTRLVRERLLIERAARATFLPLCDPTVEPAACLADLAGAITTVLPISVLLLGMGEDMHIASLLPDGDNLSDAMADDAPLLMTMNSPSQPEMRVTLTRPVLQGAISTHIVITGNEKREALENARRLNDPMLAPVCAVLHDATVHWAE